MQNEDHDRDRNRGESKILNWNKGEGHAPISSIFIVIPIF